MVQWLLEHLLNFSKRNKLDLHGLEGLTNLILKNKAIDRIKSICINNQNELYFTDIIEKVGKEKKIEAIVFDNSINLIVINDKDMLEYIEKNI